MTLRVRFAPSPTGYLHVGGARTALFNWLLARGQHGTFILRIEDTDRERSDEAHTQAILHGLSWLGLDWDEGPYFQSDGLERHRRDALQLLGEGKAYRDFTTPESLRAIAGSRDAENVSGVARALAEEMGEEESAKRAAAGEPHAIRFRVPEGETRWDDVVHGEMRFANADLDDLVILRSDGTPTYNMAVVSDDVEQRVTHVLRGDDHISNTPKQILLYRALGRPVPVFGHMPLILGADGKRLSKRHGATAVGEYESEGILPEAMFNFLSLLGWNPGDEREVMSQGELVAAFSLARLQKKSAVFDVEKLGWLNGQHLARTPAERLVPMVLAQLERAGSIREPPRAAANGSSASWSCSRCGRAPLGRSPCRLVRTSPMTWRSTMTRWESTGVASRRRRLSGSSVFVPSWQLRLGKRRRSRRGSGGSQKSSESAPGSSSTRFGWR